MTPPGHDYIVSASFEQSSTSSGYINETQVLRGEVNTLQFERQNAEIQLQAEIQELKGRIAVLCEENSSLKVVETSSHAARASALDMAANLHATEQRLQQTHHALDIKTQEYQLVSNHMQRCHEESVQNRNQAFALLKRAARASQSDDEYAKCACRYAAS